MRFRRDAKRRIARFAADFAAFRTTEHVEGASFEHRAAYVADIASQLADLIADCPRIAVAQSLVALEAALPRCAPERSDRASRTTSGGAVGRRPRPTAYVRKPKGY